MGYRCMNHGDTEAEECRRRHSQCRWSDHCFEPLVLMYIDDNQCSEEDEVQDDAQWWDTEGADECHHHHHHHHDNCHNCHHPHVLMYIDDNLGADGSVAADYGWEWCLVEDEFGRRRWIKRRTCCSPRVLMNMDFDPCVLAEAEADHHAGCH